jgi:Domain of unknown function (DUF5010)/DUF5010 C-terminal domain
MHIILHRFATSGIILELSCKEAAKRVNMKSTMKIALALSSLVVGLTSGAVPEADVTLVPIVSANRPIFFSLTGYANRESRLVVGIHQMPLYFPYEATDPDWWDNMVAEQLHGRMSVMLMATRGVVNPNDPNDLEGFFNPRQLVRMIAAYNRAGITPRMMKVACFVDTKPFQRHYNHLVRGNPNSAEPVNFADTANVEFTFFDRGIKPWYDTVPRDYWFTVKMNGISRPLIQFWNFHPSWSANMQGNISRLLTNLANRFEQTYGVRPCFFMGHRLVISGNQDSTVATQADVYAFHDWFIPSTDASYTIVQHNGVIAGHLVPGYENTAFPNDPDHIITRNGRDGRGVNGDTLVEGLSAAVNNRVSVMSIEGWTDDVELAGLYRSLDFEWTNPNQYINIMRKYNDLRTETLRLEFEGCDAFFDRSFENLGGRYRRGGGLDIQKNTDASPGWSVGWVEAEEWMEFRDIELAPGTYTFSIRYAALFNEIVTLSIDGFVLSRVDLPSTGQRTTYDTYSLGTTRVLEGSHTLRLTANTGDMMSDGSNLSLDWMFVKRVMKTVALRSSFNALFVTAVNGGGDLVRADSSTAANFQEFIICDRNGGTLESGDLVNIQCPNGLYLSAEDGGKKKFLADRTTPTPNEQFTILKKSGARGTITSGEEIVLQSRGRQYVKTGKSGSLDVTGTKISRDTTFTLTDISIVPQTVTFTSIAAEDGYVTESTGASNVGGTITSTQAQGAALRIGDTATAQQIVTIVSFDTSAIPEGAVIQSATLRLRRGAIVGNPSTSAFGLIRVDIKGTAGGFSDAVALQVQDFQAGADGKGVATMSYPAANNDWSTGELSATGRSLINSTGRTQFRVYFANAESNNGLADHLGFFSGESATNSPVLVVTYQ